MNKVIKYKGEISIKDGAFLLTMDPDAIIRFKSMFQKVAKYEKHLTLSVTNENAYDLQWFLSRYPMKMSAEAKELIFNRSIAYQETLSAVERMLQENYKPDKEYKMVFPPREYQIVSDQIYDLKGFLLNADALGLGKTVTAICSFTDVKKLPALVTCEAHLQKQWYNQIKKFIPNMKVHIVNSTTIYKLPKADVYIITYAKLSKWADVFKNLARSAVYDECQNLRIAGSNKYEAAQYINDALPFKLGLSASPIYNYGDEIFHVLDALHTGCLGERIEFLREWCVPWGMNKYKVKEPEALGVYLRDSGLVVRRTEEEVDLQLPRHNSIIEVIPYDEKILDKIKGSATELAQMLLTGEMKTRGMAAMEFDIKLRQQTGIAKAVYVAEFVKMLLASYKNTIIFAWHREVYSILLELLEEYNPLLYTGSESQTQKEEHKNLFMNGFSRIMIISLRSGTGLDGLQEHCHTCVFGELDWSPEVMKQCIGRIRRQGQTKAVQAFYLIADGGSDPTLCDLLGLKLDQAEGIMNPTEEHKLLFTSQEAEQSRVRLLAQNYLKKVKA